jgi:cytochrome c oxidase subunit 2
MPRKLVIALISLLAAGAAQAEWALNMPEGVTDLSKETYDLHMLIFWVCVWIGVAVFGVMIYSIFAHRQSKGAKPESWSHSTAAEIIWTAIPVFILLALAVPTARTLIKIEDTRDPDLTIVATGYQWKWHYQYQDEDMGFYSTLSRASLEARRKASGIDPFSVDNYLLDVDNPVVVPVNKKVRVLLTSNDVLHAWWIPEFATTTTARPKGLGRNPRLDHDHQPQGHRHAVPAVQPGHHVLRRRRPHGPGHPRGTRSSPACSSSTRVLQLDDDDARADHGLRRGHAGLRRPGQLDDPDDDRGARHGAAAHEQLELLDPAFRLQHAAARRCSCRAAARPAAGPCTRRWCCRPATPSRS